MKESVQGTEFLRSIDRHLDSALAQIDADNETKSKIKAKFKIELCRDFGGQQQYIPKSDGSELTARDIELYNKFNGHNHAALAKQFDLSEVRVYQIVKIVNKQEIAKRQGDMFDE